MEISTRVTVCSIITSPILQPTLHVSFIAICTMCCWHAVVEKAVPQLHCFGQLRTVHLTKCFLQFAWSHKNVLAIFFVIFHCRSKYIMLWESAYFLRIFISDSLLLTTIFYR